MLVVCGRLRVYLLKRQLTEGQKARSVHALSDKKKQGFSYGHPHMYADLVNRCQNAKKAPRPRDLGRKKKKKRPKRSLLPVYPRHRC